MSRTVQRRSIGLVDRGSKCCPEVGGAADLLFKSDRVAKSDYPASRRQIP